MIAGIFIAAHAYVWLRISSDAMIGAFVGTGMGVLAYASFAAIYW